MKAIFTILLFIFAQTVHSQNWAPINTSTKFNYAYGNADYATNTIWVDSVHNPGANPTYILNRIVTKNPACDSIIEISAPGFPDQRDAYCNLCRAYKNQPQFLQKKITVSNGIYHFKEPRSFVLDVGASVGTIWVFDTLNAITAEVTSTNIYTLFGEIDSVKTITLSTGDSIQLTKEHGLLLFPDLGNNGTYYRLIGTENPNAGETVPGFFEMFDYEVGGVICKTEVYYDSENPYSESTSKTTIISKQVFSDKFIYEINTIFKVHGTFPETTYVYTNPESLTFQNIAGAMYNSYNHQLRWINDSTYYYIQLSKQGGKYLKSLGETYNTGFDVFFKPNNNSDTLFPTCGYLFSTWTYMEGSGKILDYSECNSPCLLYGNIDYTYGSEEYSYLPDGLSHEDYCLPHDVSVNELTASDFQLFPNPAKNELTIIFDKNLFGHIKISDQTGQLILQTSIENISRKVLDISFIPAGIYFVEVGYKERSSFQKLVILH